MSSPTLYLIIGSAGAFLVLFAFVMNQTNRWKNDNIMYDFVNALGSIFLVIYALSSMSIPFIIINVVWGTLSLKDVAVKLLKK